jgi:cell wall-associated NlpC family hydrolase
MAALVTAGMAAGSALPSASADAVSNKRAQAQALSDQIDALGRKESALAEQYNAAVLAAQSTATKVSQQQAAVAAADANANKAKTAIQSDAVSAYVHGGTLASLVGRNGGVTAQADGGLLAGEYMSTLASTQSDNLDAFHSAASTARIAATQLDALQKRQAKAAAATNAARSATISAQQKVQSALGQVKGELTTLVAQAEAAKQAAAAQAAQALLARVQTSIGGGGGGGGANFAAVPVPVGVGAGAAVAAAKSRLGSPYVWGAAGPGAFDCSGLVMWAWGHAGVSLPHFSGAQYASTTHISMSQLQPGDLVFPSNPGSHVAMYIGGGMIIESPHSGAVVHIVPLSSWFVLASRP